LGCRISCGWFGAGAGWAGRALEFRRPTGLAGLFNGEGLGWLFIGAFATTFTPIRSGPMLGQKWSPVRDQALM
jgi:hypothetical protein